LAGKRLAARILEHQHGSTTIVRQFERSHRPGRVELIFQAQLVSKVIESSG
jgi:hypothetical protein